MTVSGLAELTLQVRDLQTLERFYTEVFGLRVLKREDDRVWLATGRDSRLGLWLPGVGNVLERVADAVEVREDGQGGEELHIRLGFAT